MKKKCLLGFFILYFVLSASECNPPDPEVIRVSGVSLSQTTASLSPGGTLTLTATVQPSNATNKTVIWSSNNTARATVSSSGGVVIIPNSATAGSVTITATTGDGNYKATCTVTVTLNTIPVTSVSISPATVSLSPGGTQQLTATITPSNATNKNVTWSSNATGVATVSTSGIVTAVSAGTATITVTTVDGNKTATRVVTVIPSSSDVTVNVTTPGTLCSQIGGQKNSITSLKVTGSLNGADILCIREMAGSDITGNSTSGKLEKLDLTGANIVSGGGYYYNYSSTSNNTIGNYMFYNCSKLATINLPSSVTSIGSNAFQYAGITSIAIPTNVTSIGGSAFMNCTNLVNVNIDNGLTTLNFSGTNTFDVSNIKTLHMGRNITWDNWGSAVPFQNKTTLTTLTISSNVTSIGNSLFQGCSGLSSAVTIPNSVTSIGDSAFDGCVALSAVTIGVNVETIGYKAFNQCRALTSITIPNKVTSIGGSAFADCDKLANVTIENGSSSLKFSGIDTFSGSNIKTLHIGRNITWDNWGSAVPFQNKTTLTTLTISSNVTSIGNSLFQGCSGLSSAVTIPNSVTSIGDSAFDGCVALSAVTIGVNVETIGYKAFNQCRALTSITIPNKVTSIGGSAFADCDKLANVTIENGSSNLKFSGIDTFNGSNIKTLHMGRNITWDNWGSAVPFQNKTTLTTLTISSNVSSIGNGLFQGCTGLATITSQNTTPPTAGSNCFDGVNIATCKVYVPASSIAAYKAAAEWGKFTSISAL